MKPYKARGIVLHTLKYGESSMVAYVLTDTLGRQNYMVRGVRSAHGRGSKGALFQPMFILEIEGMELRGAEMHRIKEVRNLVPLASLPFDVRKSTIALFMAETLYRLIREVEVNSPLFDFVYGAVQALDEMQEGVANFHLWFLVRLTSLMGFHPGNEACAGDWFDIREGLFCRHRPEHRQCLSPENAALLDALTTVPVQELHTLPLSRTRRVEFLSAMLDYFAFHLDTIRNIQSVQILKEVF
ncbi:MAG: DNA repair protein RecO [Rikenellaceae bacterium]|jgi:DNA repair protein RecO (recombination protein O)|nr:DNA repair protein RecO [Rikenellaceae bacterium]